MGRSMPSECHHGRTLDWGDFGDEWNPYLGVCSDCIPTEQAREMTIQYRLDNRHWLEEFHRRWYEQHDMGANQ